MQNVEEWPAYGFRQAFNAGSRFYREKDFFLINNSFQINDVEKGKLEHALGQFDDSIKRFMQSANAAIEQICVAAIRPKLKAR